MSTFNFKNAVTDYRFLKNRGYPAKASLKLVGDRYRLPLIERNCLLRGVVEDDLSLNRQKKKRVPGEITGTTIGIDWFNVLITVESYLKGSLLFLADDGIIRDAAKVHGSYRRSPLTNKAVQILFDTLSGLSPRHVDIFIDSPISHSKKIRDELETFLLSAGYSFSFALELAASADYLLKDYPGLTASSDSVVIDHCRGFIDLPAIALEKTFSFRASGLTELFSNNHSVR